jgi:TRAP-type C4-dicarboxylate transport system substrate-binding protein
MTGAGVTDFSVGDISKMAGDDPVFEGCDLAGLTTEVKKAREACEAWKPIMNEHMQERFNAKLMALGNNAPLALWCNVPISKLEDIRGKKVRVFNSTQADFISALGGATVTMNFAEVVPALERGVVDCAVTSTMGGNTAGWTEVTTHLYPVGLGWSIYYTAVNLDAWNRFPEPVRAFLDDELGTLEDDFWGIGQKMTDEGIACNTAQEGCTIGKEANMTLVELTPEERAKKNELVQDNVLVSWGKRCGKDCAAQWNDTVGKVLGMQIPLDKL